MVLYAILTNRRPVMDPAGKYPAYFGFPAAGRKPPTTLEGAKVLNQQECERDPVKCLRFENQVGDLGIPPTALSPPSPSPYPPLSPPDGAPASRVQCRVQNQNY